MHMANKSEAQPLAEARQILGDSAVFIKAVTDLADKREVLASDDIFSSGRVKLVSRGTKLSGGFYQRLTAHKLLKPIEHSVEIADLQGLSRIVALGLEAVEEIPSLQALLGDGLVEQLGGLLSGVRIPEPLAMKIAVMQEERPRLFKHSLLVTVTAMALGIRGKLVPRELRTLALSSLFHDIGELYIDPGFLDQPRRLSLAERHHVDAHPITGYLLLRECPSLPPGVAETVLQHHERLDGSGYPYRLSAGKLSLVSRYLAIAEVTSSLIEKHGADRRIGMVFRMNIKQYDAQAVTIICRLFQNSEFDVAQDFDERRLVVRFEQLGALFAEWDALMADCSSAEATAIEAVVDRVDGVRLLILEPGYEQNHFDGLLAIAGESDPDVCLELTALLDELTWHLGVLCSSIERDQRMWGMHIPEALRPRFDAWLGRVWDFVAEPQGERSH
jgi:HD-GYP domain-containing protein (c-di-GMP phosphodiesterase class II)